ncbi:MAG: type II secretion system F family protein [Candidatus Omnitrophota bacterium]
MANYQYKARDKFAKAVSGVMGGESKEAVAAKLSSMGYVPISIEEKKGSGFGSLFAGARKIKSSDLNMFTRQLATLQKAGLPILSSLKALREQAVNRALREIIGQVLRDIEGGSSLSSALSRHPKVFNALYVNMVNSGETGGMLGQVLERLADLGEHDDKIRMRIMAATRYPVIVVIAMALGFLVLVTVVVPRFSRIYAQFTTALPLPTRILIGVQYAVTRFWWLMILVIAALFFGFNKFINTKQGRFLWDNFKLKVPVFGALVVKLSMSRFARLTGTLMRSGVPILKILELSAGGAGNIVISRVIDNIRASVNEGKGMTEPMRASGVFPPVVVQMVSAGEETGKVDELLLHVSDYYDAQAEYIISNLTSLIEPILILVLGSGVLFMAMGIFLPMWNVMSLFKR